MLQRSIGNQGMLRLMPQRVWTQTDNQLDDGPGQETEQMRDRSATSGLSWGFSKIPLFPTERASRSQASSSRSGIIQPKLAIGPVDDPLEHEADRVADQVMRMPAPGPAVGHARFGGALVQRECDTCKASPDDEEKVRRQAAGVHLRTASADPATLRRDIGLDEIQEHLVTAFLNSQETVQRQAAGPEEDDDTAAGEQILMQAKRAGPQPDQPGAELETGIDVLEGRGDPLPSAVRDDMGGRFGYDFGRVRIHADASAAALARQVNARAFTIGRNVAFASGEYAPNGTADSRRLLAHELTHVIQQGQAGPRLQRKISVAGKDYTPSATYLTWLNANFGPAMKEFVEQMHNGGKPPVFSFSSFEQMGFEVRIRANAIKGIEEVHKGCCNYFDSAHPPYLDSTYWDHIGSGVDFKLKSPLPAGKHPSDAILAIFAPGAGTRLECLAMTRTIEYYAMLKAIGAAKFDAQFAGGIEISQVPGVFLYTEPTRKYQILTVANKSEMLPGDWVYFKNFKDYTTRVPGGFWQGENAFCLGGGKYRGFGVAALSENDLNQELVTRYNSDGTPQLSKTVADLIADGGGLLLTPVIRPIISKIAP
jgi:hypothetical protein